MLNFIGIFWTVWRGGGSVHVTDELVAGRDSGAVGSSPVSDRKLESWEQLSSDEGAVGKKGAVNES